MVNLRLFQNVYDIAHSYRVMIKKHAEMSIEPAQLRVHLMTARCQDAKNGGKFEISFKNNPNANLITFQGKTLQLINITIDTH